MKKTTLLIIGSLAATPLLRAQSLERQVIGSVGGSFSGAFQVDWTVGETVIQTASGGSSILTQGFHQPPDLPNAVKPIAAMQGISAFPNPTGGMLNLTSLTSTGDASVFITDMSGKAVNKLIWNTASPAQIDLGHCAPGVYNIQVHSGGKLAVFKITRI